jgi:hypothetical protein
MFCIDKNAVRKLQVLQGQGTSRKRTKSSYGKAQEDKQRKLLPTEISSWGGECAMNSNKKSACGTATATSTKNNKTDLIISSAAEKIKLLQWKKLRI